MSGTWWSPKPIKDFSSNELFPVDETVTVINKGLTPLQRQRMLDGTPHTRHGRTALRPEGPTLVLGNDKLNKSFSEKKASKPELDPDAVIKAYLSNND